MIFDLLRVIELFNELFKAPVWIQRDHRPNVHIRVQQSEGVCLPCLVFSMLSAGPGSAVMAPFCEHAKVFGV